MTQAVAAFGRRYLPRGWKHLALQFAIWFGFLIAYQAARGICVHDAHDLDVLYERIAAYRSEAGPHDRKSESNERMTLARSSRYWQSI